MGTLIRNGTIVTAGDCYRADLRLEGERIVEIGLGLDRPGEVVLDARDRLILPGGVDAHTHLDLEVLGATTADDFESGTIAAAFGGTTTVLDFVVPTPGQPLLEALAVWRAKAEGRAVVDYGFHLTLAEVSPRRLDELDAALAEGVTSVKLFTAYPGTLMLDDGAILCVLRWAARRGALVQVHAENGLAIAELATELAAQGKTDPLYHALSRPPLLEGEAVARVITLAEVAEAPIYIVHLSCQEALAAVQRARAAGRPVFAETCPQYLYLASDDLDRPGFEGAKFVCSPPLRPRHHAAHLWRALAAGDLQVVATDHCPFHYQGQKELGRDDFRRIPNGLPGIETRLPLIHQGVVEGKLSLNRMVELTATAPAKLFGLYPRKGAIIPGADADLVLWDASRVVELSRGSLHLRVDYSPYEGMTMRGGPDKVFLRGALIVDGDRFLGPAGGGRYLARERFAPPQD